MNTAEHQLNRALEEFRELDHRITTTQALVTALESQPLTLEVALEADRLLPSYGVLAAHFAAGTREDKKQLALEGFLEGLRDMIAKLLKALAEMANKAANWLRETLRTDSMRRAEELLGHIKEREQALHQAGNSLDGLAEQLSHGRLGDYTHTRFYKLLHGQDQFTVDVISGKSPYFDHLHRLHSSINPHLAAWLHAVDEQLKKVEFALPYIRWERADKQENIQRVQALVADMQAVLAKLPSDSDLGTFAQAQEKLSKHRQENAGQKTDKPFVPSQLQKLLTGGHLLQLFNDFHSSAGKADAELMRLSTTLAKLATVGSNSVSTKLEQQGADVELSRAFQSQLRELNKAIAGVIAYCREWKVGEQLFVHLVETSDHLLTSALGAVVEMGAAPSAHLVREVTTPALAARQRAFSSRSPNRNW